MRSIGERLKEIDQAERDDRESAEEIGRLVHALLKSSVPAPTNFRIIPRTRRFPRMVLIGLLLPDGTRHGAYVKCPLAHDPKTIAHNVAERLLAKWRTHLTGS